MSIPTSNVPFNSAGKRTLLVGMDTLQLKSVPFAWTPFRLDALSLGRPPCPFAWTPFPLLLPRFSVLACPSRWARGDEEKSEEMKRRSERDEEMKSRIFVVGE